MDKIFTLVTPPKLQLIRHYFKKGCSNKKTKPKCPETEECVCPYDGPMKSYQIVKEKVCEPCPYNKWQMTIPDLKKTHASKVKAKTERTLKECWPGMAIKDMSTTCVKKKQAEDCWTQIDVMNVHNDECCESERNTDKKNAESPDGKQQEKKKAEKPRCPEPDWEL